MRTQSQQSFNDLHSPPGSADNRLGSTDVHAVL